jgi:hypothetical protein
MSSVISRLFAAAVCLTLVCPVAAAAQSKPVPGSAGVVFAEVEPGLLGFESGVDADGVPGRIVQLVGDIEGINFEPGVCVPGVDLSLGFPTSCVTFGSGPGQFLRLHAGKTAFTTCACTVGGAGEPGDTVILKISYPNAFPPQYPAGFTKFTFQDGTGALANLRGQGTLDFSTFPQVTFKYQFAGK